MRQVRLFAAARAAAGVAETTTDAVTVAELRAELAKQHGRTMDRLLPACSVLVDGVNAHDDLTPIPRGAVVDVLPPFAGG